MLMFCDYYNLIKVNKMFLDIFHFDRLHTHHINRTKIHIMHEWRKWLPSTNNSNNFEREKKKKNTHKSLWFTHKLWQFYLFVPLINLLVLCHEVEHLFLEYTDVDGETQDTHKKKVIENCIIIIENIMYALWWHLIS